MRATLQPVPPRGIFPAGFPLGTAEERGAFIRRLDRILGSVRTHVVAAWDNGQPIEIGCEGSCVERERDGFTEREPDGGRCYRIQIARRPTPGGWRAS